MKLLVFESEEFEEEVKTKTFKIRVFLANIKDVLCAQQEGAELKLYIHESKEAIKILDELTRFLLNK